MYRMNPFKFQWVIDGYVQKQRNTLKMLAQHALMIRAVKNNRSIRGVSDLVDFGDEASETDATYAGQPQTVEELRAQQARLKKMFEETEYIPDQMKAVELG